MGNDRESSRSRRSKLDVQSEALTAPEPLQFIVLPAEAGRRLDQFLVSKLPDSSRARVQQAIDAGHIRVNGAPAKAALKLRDGDLLEVNERGLLEVPPLRAIAEDIPLDVVYEDDDLAVVNKPAGMMVHAGAGATDSARNRGTLVNALLHRFKKLSSGSDALRPGIVHRLDRDTSGLVIVAKNDRAHRRLAAQFAGRMVKKVYIALVHGWPPEHGTIAVPIARDPLRRTRMTTTASSGREAVTHFRVLKKIASPYGRMALLEVHIETGRTHQIRVHMASVGHPVIGDVLYGAPRELKIATRGGRKPGMPEKAAPLARNFLHAAAIEFTHPRTGQKLSFRAELPAELRQWLQVVETLQVNPK